ncbi:hypothetical protein D3C86_1584600 [compost metagenome]
MPVIFASARGSGESEVSPFKPFLYTIASHPAIPVAEIKIRTHKIASVNIAHPNPLLMSLCGFLVSSATFAIPSIPRKNQMAKGMAANTPVQPLGKALWVRLTSSNFGNAIPENSNSSPTAKMVTMTSNEAAAFTP